MANPKPTNIVLGIQSGTDNTVYAQWQWTPPKTTVKNAPKNTTAGYNIKWEYGTGDGSWFAGSSSTVDGKNPPTYSPPSNAKRVKFTVKPVSKTYKKNKKDVYYWTASSASDTITLPKKEEEPKTIEQPSLSVSLDGLLLTVTGTCSDANATAIQFQIIQDDTTQFGQIATVNMIYSSATYSTYVSVGHRYKVSAQAIGNANPSGWTSYSSNYGTIPEDIYGTITVTTVSQTEVSLSWERAPYGATGYTIEYTKDINKFDTSPDEVQSKTFDNAGTLFYITGLETGNEYYFRVKATNNQGSSQWTPIVMTILGTIPVAPTTWSSVSTAVIGEDVVLYWTHNCEDGSKQSEAEIEIIIYNGSPGTPETIEIENDSNYYVYSTKNLKYDSVIKWRVKTRGVMPQFGDWSMQRSIDIYQQPTATLSFYETNQWRWDPFNFETDDIFTAKGDFLNPLREPITIKKYPIFIGVKSSPTNQTPMECYLSIESTESYTTLDSIGNEKLINAGDEIYSKYLPYTETLRYAVSDFRLVLLPQDVDLEDGMRYKITATVSMSSGLVAETSAYFTVDFDEILISPNASIGYDDENISTYIQPYCVDDDGNLIQGVRLAVYRRNFDGEFVKISDNLDNMSETTVVDPHPNLNYARYRIVAFLYSNGSFSFYDIPPYPIPETSIVIQWNEKWSNFGLYEESEFSQPIQSGSMLRLPYNIDTSQDTQRDVELIEYIGREHPVSYYGTQIGQTASFSSDIPADDEETIYAIRRLQRYMGDVYIREPSGSGYWAKVDISFTTTHCSVIIPVSLTVTRVEGGV